MVCKNCSAEFDDSAAQCPECGMENEAVTESFEETNESTEAVSAAQENEIKQSEAELASDEDEEQPQEDTASEEPEEEKVAVEKPISGRPERVVRPAAKKFVQGNSAADASAQQVPVQGKPVQKAPVQGRPTGRPVQGRPAQGGPSDRPAEPKNIRRRPVKATKKEKRVMTAIIAIVCIIGLCAGVSAYLNITTDLFRVDTSTDKIVAGVGLLPDDEKQLEEFVANCFSVAKNEVSALGLNAEYMLEKINPADKGNIYSRVNNTVEKLQKTPDPARRFADENGEYAYYKLSEKRVDKVLECFGLESCHCENEKSYYYYDGYYYFACDAADSQLAKAEVTKTRRILDGRYFAEFHFYTENEGEIKKSKTRYLVFEMDKDEMAGKVSFTLEKISSKNFVGSDGKLDASAKACETKKEVIEGRTKDGTLFCRYVIEYPVLEGEEAGVQNVNGIFENTVSVYKLKAEDAEAEYKRFKKKGGEKEQLPYVENVVASVIFEDEKNISFIEKIYKFDPLVEKEEKVTTEAAEEEYHYDYYYTEPVTEPEPEIKLYDITVESYTVDRQSGNFISKDSVIGKDYMLTCELLYRIYNGYDYNRVLPWNEEEYDEYDYDETPEDVDGYGAVIYDSTWARTKSGITFWYKTVEGYIDEITIPSKIAKKLAKLA